MIIYYMKGLEKVVIVSTKYWFFNRICYLSDGTEVLDQYYYIDIEEDNYKLNKEFAKMFKELEFFYLCFLELRREICMCKKVREDRIEFSIFDSDFNKKYDLIIVY